MTKEPTTAGLNVTRERMIELLNEDLAGGISGYYRLHRV